MKRRPRGGEGEGGEAGLRACVSVSSRVCTWSFSFLMLPKNWLNCSYVSRNRACLKKSFPSRWALLGSTALGGGAGGGGMLSPTAGVVGGAAGAHR